MTGPVAEATASGSAHSAGRLAHIGETLVHLTDALHITHSRHAAVLAPPKCELAAAVLANVRAELGEAFGATEEAFCDAPCLQRYLRARGMDVTCVGPRLGPGQCACRAQRCPERAACTAHVGPAGALQCARACV